MAGGRLASAIRITLVIAGLAAGSATATEVPTGVPIGADVPPGGDADFSLKVSPARLVVPAGRLGERHRFTVSNKGSAAIDVVVGKSDFAPGPDGRLVFTATAPHSASTWIDVSPQRFRLGARQSRDVAVAVTVPASVEPGEHQVAVVFMVPAADDGSAGIKLNRGIGAPIYLSAPGPIDATAVVSDLSAPRLAFGGPVSLSATVTDVGTVHRDFVGNQRLAARIGEQQVFFEEMTVLRGSSRHVAATWHKPPLWCVCTVRVAVTNASGIVSERSATVVVIPIYLVLVALAFLTLAAMMLVRRRRRRAAYSVGPTTPIGDAPVGDAPIDILGSGTDVDSPYRRVP